MELCEFELQSLPQKTPEVMPFALYCTLCIYSLYGLSETHWWCACIPSSLRSLCAFAKIIWVPSIPNLIAIFTRNVYIFVYSPANMHLYCHVHITSTVVEIVFVVKISAHSAHTHPRMGRTIVSISCWWVVSPTEATMCIKSYNPCILYVRAKSGFAQYLMSTITTNTHQRPRKRCGPNNLPLPTIPLTLSVRILSTLGLSKRNPGPYAHCSTRCTIVVSQPSPDHRAHFIPAGSQSLVRMFVIFCCYCRRCCCCCYCCGGGSVQRFMATLSRNQKFISGSGHHYYYLALELNAHIVLLL